MRTVKKPETRKQEILDGAMAVFLQKGYEKATIGDIAAHLGISQGLCYRYFPSKEAIYDEVLDAYASRIAGENLRDRPQSQSIRQWIARIPSLLQTMQQAERQSPQLYQLIHSPRNEKMHRELCLLVGEKLIPAVADVLYQAQAAGELSLTDCRETAAFGIYGEIGLLLTLGPECGKAIQENWQRLLNLN